MTTARRPTQQRAAVAEALGGTEEFVSAQELHARMRSAGAAVGLATVYRTLSALAADGAVDMVRADDGEARYRRCANSGHHHHLVCRSCGRAVEIAGPDVEAWTLRIGAAHGFRQVEHTLELVGTCARC